jgi:hypothetical protein
MNLANLIKFFVFILGASTAPPITLEPIIKMPLNAFSLRRDLIMLSYKSYQAAPTTDNAMHNDIPKDAHMYGSVAKRKLPILKTSPCPLSTK